MTGTEKLPPWAGSERDRRRLIEWSIAQLDALDAEHDAKLDDPPSSWTYPPETIWWEAIERAKLAARRGNIEPLRRLFPSIAEFIHEPKRARGQRRSYSRLREHEAFRRVVAGMAAADVRRLRDVIWPRNYGRWKRRSGDGPTAEEIAAIRHDVTVDEVRQAMKGYTR
jgi:hypothetical protein